MVRQDKRRSTAEKVILGFLAQNYGVGATYREIIQGTLPQFQAMSGKEGLSKRQLIRHVSALFTNGWVNRELVKGTGRFSITREGYFHYHGVLEGRDLKSLKVVPDELLAPLMAKGIWKLTDDQTRYFREYLNQQGSLLVLLPSGAGKTLIATLEAYRHYRKAQSGNSKVLYLSPYKAINSQSTAEFRRVLGPLGVQVARQDGDYHSSREELTKANLVVSTFESAQFSHYRGAAWFQQVELVIIDELTILDSTRDRNQGGLRLPRGANLDLLVTSLRHSFSTSGKTVRFICLGIPNASQPALQKWLGDGATVLGPTVLVDRCEEKVAVFEKRESSQEWYAERKDGVRSEGPFVIATASDMQRMMTVTFHYLKKLYATSQDSKVKPVLVFVRARKDASECAIQLQAIVEKEPALALAMRKDRSGNSYLIRQSVVMPTSTVKQLSNVVNSGIGFHHAGLFLAQRKAVEQMMNDGSLSVLFATTTLTHGVDFPIGAVIIDAELLKMLGYSRLEYLQLKGRVDHKDPFHETSGTADAVVVLSQGKVPEDYQKVRELLQGVDPPLDSCSLTPPNAQTFMLRAIQYLTSQAGTTSAEQLAILAKQSYWMQHTLQGKSSTESLKQGQYVEKQSEDVVRWCVRQGLVNRVRQGIEITGLGLVADKTGTGFIDMSIISRRIKRLLRVRPERLEFEILSLALALVENSGEVDEALPRVRLYEKVPRKLHKETERLMGSGLGLQRGVLGAILSKWMEERPVAEIVIDKPDFQVYESGLLISARAVSRNLVKIAHALKMLGAESDPRVKGTDWESVAAITRLMAIRARYGVRLDVANTELGSLSSRVNLDDLVNSQGYPEFLMRIVLRLLMKKGWSDSAKLREYHGKNPITAADVRNYTLDRETAETVKTHRDELNAIALRIIQVADSDNDSDDAHGQA